MNVQLHPDIEQLDKSSLCYSIYSQLYLNFFNSQQRKDDEHPYGIEEGDQTSLRLKNTAYGFASAIAGAVNGEGSSESGGLFLEYLKKSGGDMSGALHADYGFEAGVDNMRILETYAEKHTNEAGTVITVDYGVRITGNLKIGGSNLYLGGHNVLRYDADVATATIDASHLNFGETAIASTGYLQFGERNTGVFISSSMLQIAGQDVYHQGNANLSDTDWVMRNAEVYGTLAVRGSSTFDSELSALHGVRLGDKGKCLLSFSGEDAALSGNLSFNEGYGIRIGGIPVLARLGDNRVQIGSIGGDMLLGNDTTPKIRLLSGISDVDGDCLMLSAYGNACFPGSLSVRHDYGEVLFSSYRTDTTDEGVVIHKNLRMGSADGILITGNKQRLSLNSSVQYITDGVSSYMLHTTRFEHRASTSHYTPKNRCSESFHLSTDADFVSAGVPFEATGHIGIDGSVTRLMDATLFFSEEVRLHAIGNGLKHYGDSIFLGSLSSEFFSSGFAGRGWAIRENLTSGNTIATFDEIVVRRKFRAYEIEVKKLSVTNGSLWVSDTCSGDTVEKL